MYWKSCNKFRFFLPRHFESFLLTCNQYNPEFRCLWSAFISGSKSIMCRRKMAGYVCPMLLLELDHKKGRSINLWVLPRLISCPNIFNGTLVGSNFVSPAIFCCPRLGRECGIRDEKSNVFTCPITSGNVLVFGRSH